MRIAVTGALSAGKSTVCELLKTHGAYVVSADNIVHTLLASDPDTIRSVKEVLGDTVFINGTLDRKQIANLVFTHPTLLTQLEAILHPAVKRQIQALYETEKPPLFVAEIPLLFEMGFDAWFDHILYITADPAIREARFRAKGFTDFALREERFEIPGRCTTIYNNGSLKQLTQEIQQWMSSINL